MIAPENPLVVGPGELRTTSVFVLLPRDAFTAGRRDITVRITASGGYVENFPYNLLGPVESVP